LTTTDGFLKADGLTANNNSYLGMDITLYAEDRNITNSIFKDNAQNDIRFTRSVSCKISLINVTGTGNQPIGFNYSSNISIENQTFSSLTICHAQNVTIKNVTIIGSSSLKNGEFNLYDVNNSYLIDVNASDLFYALYLTASYKNIISNSTFFRSFIPVTLSGSEKNNITNISVKWGSSRPDGWIYGAGIYLAGAHNNTIKDSQIRHNYKEAIYFLSSHQNNITNCIIENHSNGGLKFSGGSKKNVIYNNFLNNSLNYNDTTSVSNYFNITKTLGTNIVGGAYLGGNYWGDVNETGFSEIGCTDENQDNICDAVYPLGDGNYDYLPLTLISFTLPEVVVVSHGDSPAPGASQTSFLGSISSGGSATMEITNPKISITKVTVEVKDMVTGVSLTVMEISSPTQAGFEIGLPSGISYQTFEVSAIGLINENISKLIFNFRINNTWLEKQNKSVNDVNLYRKPTNMTEWSPLTTTYIGKDEKYSYFSALSPGFSSFLIFVSPAECIPAEKRCLENQAQFCLGNKKWLVSEVCDYKCEKGKCIEKGLQINLNPLVVYPIIGIVVVGVLVSFIIQRRIKMKQKISSSEAYNQYFDNIKPSEN
jgi:PGF-pre-PGF domain-containing protein